MNNSYLTTIYDVTFNGNLNVIFAKYSIITIFYKIQFFIKNNYAILVSDK